MTVLVDYRIIFIGILCFLILIVVCSGLYWLAVSYSERARAFNDYISLRITIGGIRNVRIRIEKEQKRLATIRKYIDAYNVFRCVYDGYCNNKSTVSVVVEETSLEYVKKILQKEGVSHVSVDSGGVSGLLELRIEL